MIKFVVEAKSTMLSGLEAWIEEFDDVAYSVFEETFDEIEPQLMEELRIEAPERRGKVDWTSEKQKFAFFATNGFGGGIPTRRTGEHRNAWIAKTKREGSAFYFIVDNPLPTSKFIYGSLAKKRASALRFQQRFHAQTGWQPATDTVQFWLEAFRERYLEKMKKISKTRFKGRAVTR